jgi:glutamate-ammonia-ligase adenylyltransferase
LVQQELLKLDCESDLSLEEVMSRISKLAEFSLLKASESINGQLWHSYGIPTNDDGSMCQIAIISMGKLGAKELNVSSDVDLVYVYEMEGQTQIDPKKSGQKSISNVLMYTMSWPRG